MNIDEMTEAEILALTDEEIEREIKFRMASDGIPVYPRPVEPTYEKVAGPDARVHSIAGLYFDNRGSAERVQTAIMKEIGAKVSLHYQPGDYNTRYAKLDNSNEDVTSQPVYSWASYEANQVKLASNAKLKTEYEQARTDYEKAQRQAVSIRADVTEVIEAARAAKERREMLLQRYTEYVEIADGNRETALEFLRRAFPMTDDEAELLRAAQV